MTRLRIEPIASRPVVDARALGHAVAAQRKRLGLSQAGLAEVTGLHRAYIAGLESGRRNPTWSTAGSLAAGLGTAMSDLVLLAEALDERDLPPDDA